MGEADRMIHIHWHKFVSSDTQTYRGGIWVTRVKKVCRCGSVKLQVEGFS